MKTTSGPTPPDRYAVMGNPVAHSKSPRIHALFAQQTGQAIEYAALLVEQDGFARAVAQFRSAGGKGLNVTVPFKIEAFQLADDHVSERARLAGAVNTLSFDQTGRIFGDNTDGAGLVHDLIHNLRVTVKDRRLLILGAGGSVRGILGPLLKQHPREIVIANRTVARARELVTEFAGLTALPAGVLADCGFGDLTGRHFDLVINATSASLKGELPPPLPDSLLANHATAYDLMYGGTTPFMDWAVLHGAEIVTDGLGMLVEQAAESFLLWRGVRPETRPVITALRGECPA